MGARETERVNLNWGDVAANLEECRLSLVGRIIEDKVTNYIRVKIFTNHVWGYPRNMKVTKLGPNVFQFNFEKEQDRDKALRAKCGFWIINF